MRRVHSSLPGGQANFYERSFDSGENLISAMEERVANADIFVLFASRASLSSTWVGFEIDRARLNKIKNSEVSIFIFPVEDGIPFELVPDWMKEFWITKAGWLAKDVARYIRKEITDRTRAKIGHIAPQGRGALLDKIRRKIATTTLEIGESPKIFVLAGLDGIGRRTVRDQVLLSAYPAQPYLSVGPIFKFPALADLEDIFRALRLEVSDTVSSPELAAELRHFGTLNATQKVDEIINILSHFNRLGQSVTFISGNLLYEDKGVLKDWVEYLFFQILALDGVVVTFICNRSIHQNELKNISSAIQETIDPLEDDDIKTIIASALRELGHEPVLPDDGVVRAIGGHPAVARAVARVLGSKGVAIVNRQPKLIFDEQENLLAALLDGRTLTNLEKPLLTILSWVPRINGNTLIVVVQTFCGLSAEEVSDALSELVTSCLVQVYGEEYAISSPIRGMFRRRNGFGDPKLLETFATEIKKEWQESEENGSTRADIFDAMVYLVALEGASLPPEFDDLVLPSTLQEVISESYDRRHLDETALERVATWGGAAMGLSMNETVREEIASYLLRALVRLGRKSEASTILQLIEKKGYRSYHYLKSFSIRLLGGNLADAVNELRLARPIRKYRNQVISDLALCLKGLGRWDALRELLDEEASSIGKNMALTDTAVGMLIADSKFAEAEDLIEVMKSSSYDDGRAESRLATIKMKRDKDFVAAYHILTDVLNRRTRGAASVRALRGVAAARGGQFDRAEDDAAYFQHRPNGADTYLRIRAEILLKKGRYADSLGELRELSFETAQDRLLRARIVEAEALDLRTTIPRRDQLLKTVEEIRSSNRSADEFHVDW